MALTIIAALAMQPPGPETGDWRVFAEDAQTSLAVDEARIVRDGDVVRVRLRFDRPAVAADGARATVAEVEIDCRGPTATGTALHLYRPDGTLLESRRGAQARDALNLGNLPGSNGRRFMEATCHRAGWGAAGEEGEAGEAE